MLLICITVLGTPIVTVTTPVAGTTLRFSSMLALQLDTWCSIHHGGLPVMTDEYHGGLWSERTQMDQQATRLKLTHAAVFLTSAELGA